jgi:hypothetical protein
MPTSISVHGSEATARVLLASRASSAARRRLRGRVGREFSYEAGSQRALDCLGFTAERDVVERLFTPASRPQRGRPKPAYHNEWIEAFCRIRAADVEMRELDPRDGNSDRGPRRGTKSDRECGNRSCDGPSKRAQRRGDRQAGFETFWITWADRTRRSFRILDVGRDTR